MSGAIKPFGLCLLLIVLVDTLLFRSRGVHRP